MHPQIRARKEHGFIEGDAVYYHSVIGGPHDGVVRSIEVLGDANGRPVAWITEKRGYVAVDALSMAHCPSCGYTTRDAGLHLDHQRCKNYGFFPRESSASASERSNG